MTRLTTVLLVLVLSGVPATAVLCDVLFCAEPSAPRAASSACHDHVPASSGKQVDAREADCTHLSLVDPFVASVSRVLLPPVVPAALPGTLPLSSTRGPLLLLKPDHGPPDIPRSSSPRPLRI